MKTYDAIVIGPRQGGLPLAQKIVDTGLKVAIIEKGQLGGSCINYGCTPTKTMISSARIAHYARVAPQFGVHPGAIKVNMVEVVTRKNEVVSSFRNGLQEGIDNRSSLTLHRSHARFATSHEIEVNGERLASDKIFINTGTRPRIVSIPGLAQVPFFTNRNVMDLQELPEHLIALGGNYLGLEFGQMFRRLGSKVTVVELGDEIVAREDPEVSRSLREALEGEGMQFRLGSHATMVAKTKAGVDVTIEKQNGNSETLQGSHLLVCIGQVPNSDHLGLDKAGIAT